MFSEMNSLVGRVGVVTEQRAQDQFRRHFGAKKASRLKQVGAGLVASAERGLVSVFQVNKREEACWLEHVLCALSM